MENISVLVVDDEPGIAALCKRILNRAGYDVTSLTDPRAAIEHLQQQRVDLLVVDIRMPEVDGFDLISRAQVVQPDIPVLVMTAFGTLETASDESLSAVPPDTLVSGDGLGIGTSVGGGYAPLAPSGSA